MVFVKGGKFRMGCPDLAGAGCLADERPRQGIARVYRGGSFNSAEVQCRASLRNYAVPGYRTLNFGFRLARSP